MRQTKVQIYKHWFILAEELYQASEPNRNTPYLGDYRRRKLYGAVVFLALALESFINELGLEYCSDDFASIDRLPAPAKWLIVPKLTRRKVCSKVESLTSPYKQSLYIETCSFTSNLAFSLTTARTLRN